MKDDGQVVSQQQIDWGWGTELDAMVEKTQVYHPENMELNPDGLGPQFKK